MMKGLSLCDLWRDGGQDERCVSSLTFASHRDTIALRSGRMNPKDVHAKSKTDIRPFTGIVAITPAVFVWGDCFID
jgi:hypothetical protein